MKERLPEFIRKNNLFSREDTLLVAISGGADSVLLTHLLLELNYDISLAHCNFNLRSSESDNDETFVKNFAKTLDLECFNKNFDTTQFADKNNLSIEEAARILRYEWFETLRVSKSFKYIVTGHHLNDKIETFFINLSAGTGIKGLRSIQAKVGNIVRPLLFAEQREIADYCTENNIKYRTDQSNFDTTFLRNRFRHQIIPQFNEINPNFSQTMSKNLDIYKEFEGIYEEYIKNTSRSLTKFVNKQLYINFEELLTSGAPISLLFEILHPYGFNSSQIRNLLNYPENIQSGKLFFSSHYKLLKDRKYLIVAKLTKENKETYIIEENQKKTDTPISLSFEYQDINKRIEFKKDSNIALLDADKIKFPLIIRNREDGDFFYPLGMSGKKKLSDFFIDLKLNQFEKENTWLLISGDNIIWVIDQRIDNRYKVTSKTKRILKIERL